MVDGRQVAIFLLGHAEGRPLLRAIDNYDPCSGANVLARGIVGSTDDIEYVASPMHKQRFDLASGRCLDGDVPPIRVWPIRAWGRTVEVLSITDGDPHATDPHPTATHCPFCALQCGMKLQVVHQPSSGPEQLPTAPVEVLADNRFPVNKGRMCIKGWAAPAMLDHGDRLTTPMIRDASGVLRATTWDAALAELADRLTRTQTDYGRDAVGVFGSGALTNEKAYLLGKFARVALGTANIDYNGRFCMSSAAAGQNRAFGIDRGMPFPLEDVEEADTLLLWGANPADTMPPLMQYVERLRDSGGKLIVVDPRLTATAQMADVHVQPIPGTDLALALGILDLVVAEGLTDDPYLNERATGWEAVLATTGEWPPARVTAVTGVSEPELRQIVQLLAQPRSIVLTGRGPEQQSKGADTVTAIINVMLALGKVGRRSSGYGCLTGQANGQGGREHGQKADQLPGYRSITDPHDRSAIGEVWGVNPESLPGPGMSVVEMVESIGEPGGIRALVIVGSNLALAAPNGSRVAAKLASLDCLAVLDTFPSATTELADIVLPVTQWAEEDGTTTNLEGRVIRRRAAIAPRKGVHTDVDVLCDLARRLGSGPQFAFTGAEQVFEELRRATRGAKADYSGITYARLDDGHGIFWPCPEEDHDGTPRMFTERFAHPDGLARVIPVAYREAAESPDGQFPIYFTTGRYREQYNSGSQTLRLERLARARPEPLLQIHPDLVARLDLDPEASVLVESRRGAATFHLELSEEIRRDTVFAPFHWGGKASANLVTNPALDPVSKMPEFKVCAVRLVQ
jgi:assimilatory nitrate reductase catalytic subunit